MKSGSWSSYRAAGSYGEKMKTVREQRKWNQMEAAKELGICQGHVSLIENGRRLPGSPLQRLIDALLLNHECNERTNPMPLTTPSYIPTFANPRRLQVEDALETVRELERQFQSLFNDGWGEIQDKGRRIAAKAVPGLLDRLRGQIEGLEATDGR